MITKEGSYSGEARLAFDKQKRVFHAMFHQDGFGSFLTEEDVQPDNSFKVANEIWEPTKDETYHLREDGCIEMITDGVLFVFHPTPV